jgi:hypothetical protein
MSRVLLVTAVLVMVPAVSRGEQAVARLDVQAMPAPRPALKYQLLPEVRELNPGNPVQFYIRCFAEQRIFFFTKESDAERARYLSIPLAELPPKLRGYGGNALRQADWAARLDAPDWQLVQRVQSEGMDMVVSELGPLQTLGTALQVRFRFEVATHHYDDAVRNAKTMFALARHLGEHPTGAGNRVGLVIADMAMVRLEEMVQQPGCPNLYWALTDLPSPLVDLRKGVQGDRALVATDLDQLKDDTVMTDEQLERVVRHLAEGLSFAREQAGQPPRSLRAQLQARASDAARLAEARRRLVESGRTEDLVRRFPPLQVVLLDAKHDYEVRRDEAAKLLALAPRQIDALRSGRDTGRGDDGLFNDLLPKVIELRRAQARLEQRVALLRHVEALRLHAAGHGGKLPSTLADAGVPLPDDPFTGKPFVYKLDGTTAHLVGGPSDGHDGDAGVRYEVTVRK